MKRGSTWLVQGKSVSATIEYPDLILSINSVGVSEDTYEPTDGNFSAKLIARVARRFAELARPGTKPIRLSEPCGAAPTSQPAPATVTEYKVCMPGLKQILSPYLCTLSRRSELYGYQVTGVDWLKERPHRILADDMGLGKSAQVIIAFRELLSAGELDFGLFVAPVNLCTNWQREFRRWAPELNTLVCRPDSNSKGEVWNAVLGRYHAIITNYEQLRDCPALLRKHSWNLLLVADEAHRLRNMKSQLSIGFRQVKADRVWALTGTPLERNSDDIRGLLVALTGSSGIPAGASPKMVRAILAPKLLRRTKQEVLSELPDAIETTEWVELQGAQLDSYKDVERQFRLAAEPILALFTQLRTICDFHPATKQSAKADYILELVKKIRSAGEKCVIFSYILAPLDIIGARFSKEFGKNCFSRIDGSMAATERDAEVHRFKSDVERTCILISLFAGSEGLTLTEANHVIFFNRWWNPSRNRQARDRVLRIGQRKGVSVHHLVAVNTLEERLEEMLKIKSTLFGAIVESADDADRSEEKSLMKALWAEEHPSQARENLAVTEDRCGH